jgi:hypothetical protein
MADSKFPINFPQVEALISIGGECSTRYQIDKFMSKVHEDYKLESYYFDWLMMGGVTGISNILSRGFEISPTLIEIHDGGGRFIPKDRLSGHTFLHDFGMGWWEYDRGQALSRLNETMNETIEKYKYLGKKTDNILKSDFSVALVYHGVANDSDWIKLLKILFDRYRKKVLIINIIELDQKATKIDGILTAHIDNKNSPKKGTVTEWQGWDESWHSALSSLNCVKKPPYKN